MRYKITSGKLQLQKDASASIHILDDVLNYFDSLVVCFAA